MAWEGVMSLADELHKLETLHASGALSDEEYAAAKARVLNGAPIMAGVNGAPRVGMNPLRAFRRSNYDYWLGGVCGGLGQVTPIPAWAWRVAFCLAALYFFLGLILYVLLWIFVPADEESA
jgi:phage shock protein PspC (stress-responsive transcriptional regulator)